jgi:methylenetetrahydrofolate reductase (NADPH)
LDSIQLLNIARAMRDEGVFLSGRKLSTPPRFFLGAVENPFAPPLDWRPLRLAKKIAAGAEFIQTQYCFDVPRLQQFMRRACDLGLLERAYVLVGVGPLRSAKVAEHMRVRVPGVWIPDAVVQRMTQAPIDRQSEEGKRICIEIIQQVREINGVRGVHVMAFRQESR